MKYQIRDVVNTLPQYGGRTFAIVRIHDGKYYGVHLKDKKRYWLEESQIHEKVGFIQEGSPLLLLDDAYDVSEGSYYAEQKALASKDPRWEILAAAKPGDKIDVIHRNFVHEAVFVQINTNKPVKVFRAKINGVAHDLTIDSVYVEPPKPAS